MSLIVKYILNNVREKLVRTILVLLSIAVSSALFFATIGMKNTCRQMYVDQAVQLGGSSDIKVALKDEIGGAEFIANDSLTATSEKLEYQINIMSVEGLYNPDDIENSEYINLWGTTLKDLETFNSYELAEAGDTSSFEGNKIIVSQVFADEIDAQVGDTVDIKINGEVASLEVVGLAEQVGFFLNESTGYRAIVPKDFLETTYGVSEMSNLFFLKVADGADVNDTIDKLTEAMENCTVQASVNESDLNQAVNTVVMPFMVSALTVIFMSIFIIYTSFNLITLERMPAIGTFRSVGLSKRKLKFVFTVESIIWGLVGGAIGSILGIAVLYTIVVAYVQQLSEGTKLTVSVSGMQIVETLLLSVVLTMVSAIPPLFKALKKSTKDIILDLDTEKKKAKKHVLLKLIVLVAIYGLCIIIPHTLSTSLLCMIVTIVCMTVIIVVTLMLVPFAIDFIAKLFAKSSDNTTMLAMRNIETNKTLLNIVRLLQIAVASILIISNISNVISNTINSVYETYHLYDISLVGRAIDQDFCDRLSEVEGVESFANSYEISLAQIENKNFYFNTLYGIDDESFFDYMGAEIGDEAYEALCSLNDGRNIVLTELIASKVGVKVGDIISIKVGTKSYDYTVAGLVDSSFKLGNIGFISSANLSSDYEVTYYTNTYVKVADGATVTQVRNNIKAEFLEELISIQTLDELIEINSDLIVSIFRIINAYAILALIIGIIGMVNNVLVCFATRQRELAMYRTVGMSAKTMRQLFLKESFFLGVFGVLFAFISATGILNIVPYMLSFIFGNVTMKYNLTLYIVFTIFGIGVMCMISILPISRSKKLNIIECIKYE